MFVCLFVISGRSEYRQCSKYIFLNSMIYIIWPFSQRFTFYLQNMYGEATFDDIMVVNEFVCNVNESAR